MYPEALRASIRVDSPQYTQRMLMLQAAIRYEQDELPACKALLEQCLADDPDTIVNYAAIAFKEGDFEKARAQYLDAMTTLGYQADLSCFVAMCYYKQAQFGNALTHLTEGALCAPPAAAPPTPRLIRNPPPPQSSSAACASTRS
jgi:tetratricopeptide repeat protein 30